MKPKLIKKVIAAKLNKWVASLDDIDLRVMVRKDVIVTGGCIVSLFQNETPNDYDIYFKTKATTLAVAKYYAKQYCKKDIEVRDIDDRISFFIKSSGVAGTPPIEDDDGVADVVGEDGDLIIPEDEATPNFYPVFFSDNAVSLNGKIQIIIRFYGDIDEIHKNFDFIHYTCSYSLDENELVTPVDALTAIINKDLVYQHSLYPVCAIIRTRKFIKRGWTITAGQYLKMIWDCNKLDLRDMTVLRDQLVGVDSTYFRWMMEALETNMETLRPGDPNTPGGNSGNRVINDEYLFTLIDEIF
jgi:hypothetical protein